MLAGVQVRFWGTRGSIATPGPGTVRYGGNTSCVELRSDGGELVVIDCGTGARPLGQALLAAAGATDRPQHASILLGHTHWDHIQGLPFFAPLFQPTWAWDLYGPRGLGASLAQTLSGQMQYQYFPVALDQLGADVTYHDLVEGTFELGDLVVRTHYLNHTALTLGYRFEGGGRVFCYLADHEPFDPELGPGGDVVASREDRRHVEFMTGADVVVHDAQYDATEYAGRVGWGHSTMEYVVDAACAAGVGRLVLYHHDPSHDDDAIDALLARACERAAGRIEVVAAAEGASMEVRAGRRRPPATTEVLRSAGATPAMEDLQTTVIVVVRDPALRAQIEEAAAAEDLTVVDGERASGEALEAAGRAVLVIDVDDDGNGDGAGSDLLGTLQRTLDPATWSKLAVLGVTRTLRGTLAVPAAITDWLVWPATTTHVRTKLRAAVLRRACRWLAAPKAPDEERRMASLRALGVLDTPPEDRFERYTEAACDSFGVPIALITLVDDDRQWFKSHRGLPLSESPRDESVCAHAILGADVFQVPDLLEDPRFADNPAVTAGRGRFYAGAPLILDDGTRVGTLCVIDHRPRLLDDEQLEELRRLARAVVVELQRGAP
jgi:phosphoribosyl 1,2-cyclic phosphodiesterase